MELVGLFEEAGVFMTTLRADEDGESEAAGEQDNAAMALLNAMVEKATYPTGHEACYNPLLPTRRSARTAASSSF